jgi:putative (di)nucleoside polyphosphate hydrolase|tara:strand:- start:279 stop:752 length:474 start_codon:yes stop_codon:yes gene_type:complete
MKSNSKDYRPNVGMMIINQKKEIFVGKRIDHPSNFWQMPQGGIDAQEIPSIAALREMDEEVGIKKNKVDLLTESKDWYYYSIPSDLAKTLWKGKYKGQRQKWFLYKFKGTEKDINIHTEHPEFSDYKWVTKDFLVPNIVPFKKKIYEKLLLEFKDYL